ncbi:hypothetical protein B0T14DRAFT_174761 [Immersiella caudata]|uniref:Uncharacterized protein n=1 Tax=Immersiella caudata TaxID=314043 RepID=A0AA39WXC2_9PEZI|nr:hypothetical protein B0T14DRAFT_174761 [Immersiella caudata]
MCGIISFELDAFIGSRRHRHVFPFPTEYASGGVECGTAPNHTHSARDALSPKRSETEASLSDEQCVASSDTFENSMLYSQQFEVIDVDPQPDRYRLRCKMSAL